MKTEEIDVATAELRAWAKRNADLTRGKRSRVSAAVRDRAVNREELSVAHGELVRDVRRWWRDNPGMPDRHGRLAPADVPGWVLPRLAAHAHAIGYPVRYVPVIDRDVNVLGQTQTLWNVAEYCPQGIEIVTGMTPASRARVLCHELAHAHEARKLSSARERYLAQLRADRYGRPDTPAEEATAEICAALVTRALRISDGDDFSLRYLAGQVLSVGPQWVEAARDGGIARAAQILEGIK